MACRPAPACQAMLDEADRLWPRRNDASDGICPSPEHYRRNPGSDHSQGEAVDLTHDPARGVDCARLAETVIHDPRAKYVIFNRRIFNRAVSPTWRRYSGDNPHTQHMHVSIHTTARNNTTAWFTEEDDLNDADRKWIADQLNPIAVMAKGAYDNALAARKAVETPLPYLKAAGVNATQSKPRNTLGRMFLWMGDLRRDVAAIKKKLGA